VTVQDRTDPGALPKAAPGSGLDARLPPCPREFIFRTISDLINFIAGPGLHNSSFGASPPT
jgi:hypothetical protein